MLQAITCCASIKRPTLQGRLLARLTQEWSATSLYCAMTRRGAMFVVLALTALAGLVAGAAAPASGASAAGPARVHRTHKECGLGSCPSGACLFVGCQVPVTCGGGRCRFVSCVAPSCAGGWCEFQDCERASCAGGRCAFAAPRDTLVDGYCPGGACTIDGQPAEARLSERMAL